MRMVIHRTRLEQRILHMKMAFHRTLLLFNQRPRPNPPQFLRADAYFCFSQNFVTDAKLFSLTDSQLHLVF